MAYKSELTTAWGRHRAMAWSLGVPMAVIMRFRQPGTKERRFALARELSRIKRRAFNAKGAVIIARSRAW